MTATPGCIERDAEHASRLPRVIAMSFTGGLCRAVRGAELGIDAFPAEGVATVSIMVTGPAGDWAGFIEHSPADLRALADNCRRAADALDGGSEAP